MGPDRLNLLPARHASCVRVDMTAPKPKPKPRGGQRRPFARQYSSSKDVSRALRAAARGRYEYISTCFLFAQTGNHTNKQKLGLCEYIDIFYFQMMISPIKRSRSSVSCAGRGCIFCSQPSFVVSNTHAHRQLDCSRGTHDPATHFFLHYAQAACVRPEIEPRASPPSSAPHTATRVFPTRSRVP